MYKCKKCDFSCEKSSQLANHYKYSHLDLNLNLECKCGKVCKNKTGFSCHIKKCNGIRKEKFICSKCGFEIPNNRQKHFNSCDGNGPRSKKIKPGSKGRNWAKGLTKESDERIMNISISVKRFISENGYKKHYHTEKTKNLLREKMLERYANGWESTAGRCKKIEYISPVAGIIKVDGNWELEVAKYLDTLNVNWIRNKKRFKYWNSLKKKDSTYCPDFYVIDWDCYIEVKGYKTELDEIKWSQFQHKLQIWDKQKLISLGLDIRCVKKRK